MFHSRPNKWWSPLTTWVVQNPPGIRWFPCHQRCELHHNGSYTYVHQSITELKLLVCIIIGNIPVIDNVLTHICSPAYICEQEIWAIVKMTQIPLWIIDTTNQSNQPTDQTKQISQPIKNNHQVTNRMNQLTNQTNQHQPAPTGTNQPQKPQQPTGWPSTPLPPHLVVRHSIPTPRTPWAQQQLPQLGKLRLLPAIFAVVYHG